MNGLLNEAAHNLSLDHFTHKQHYWPLTSQNYMLLLIIDYYNCGGAERLGINNRYAFWNIVTKCWFLDSIVQS